MPCLAIGMPHSKQIDMCSAWHLQDPGHLYFLFDLMAGGDLMDVLVAEAHVIKAAVQEKGSLRQGVLAPKVKMWQGMDEELAKFYVGSVILALEYLHDNNLVYRWAVGLCRHCRAWHVGLWVGSAGHDVRSSSGQWWWCSCRWLVGWQEGCSHPLFLWPAKCMPSPMCAAAHQSHLQSTHTTCAYCPAGTSSRRTC